MKLKYTIGAAAFAMIAVGCSNQGTWHDTEAVIENIQKMEDGTFAYSVSYTVSESTAKNMDGDLIVGPLVQQVYGQTTRPKSGQEVTIKYRIDEPIIYKLVDKVEIE